MRKAPVRRLRTLLAWRAQALFLKFFWLVAGLLSADRASAAGAFVARVIGPRLHKHRKVRENLATALPEKGPAEIDDLARAVWGNFGAVLAEFPHLAAICSDRGASSHVEVIHEAPTDDGPKIFVLAHLANWEILTRVILRTNSSLVAIYSPQENPFVERLVQERRTLADCEFVSNTGGIQKAVAALGEGRCLVILTDQRAVGGRAIEFFGREAETTDVPARLAISFGCPLIPVRVERLGHARFRATFCEPIEPDDSQISPKAKALDMTCRLQALFEAWIRERPDQWLCAKRRWKVRGDRPRTKRRRDQPSMRPAGA